MFERLLNNKHGVALLIVMLIMSVTLIVIFVIFNIVSSETRMVGNYGNRIKAMQIAEAGADLAISEWIQYINDLHDKGFNDNGYIQLQEFYDSFDEKKNPLVSTLQEHYGEDEIDIRYKDIRDPDNLDLGKLKDFDKCSTTGDPEGTLILEITGEYAGEEYNYQVMLRYCHHGNAWYQKGL